MTDESTADRWISELRKRLHEQGNTQMRLQGEMLADRMVAEERHKQGAEQSKEIKKDISTLAGLLTDQGATMNAVAQDLRSVLQRMDADEQTRIKTAAALQAADDARRQAESGPWITPNRVILMVLSIAGILAYVTGYGGH